MFNQNLNSKTLLSILLSCSLLTSLTLVGCGEDEATAPSITLTEFNQQITQIVAENFCKQTFSCSGQAKPSPLELVISASPDEASCIQWVTDRFLGGNGGNLTEADIAQGLIQYNGANAYTCLTNAKAQFQSLGCNLDVIEDPTCEQVITGLQPLGASCAGGDHCASKACDFTNAEMVCDFGVCVEPLAESPVGGSCEDSGCVDGAICTLGGNDNLVCIAEGSRPAGETCYASEECAGSLACIQNAEGNDVCSSVSYGDLGATCDIAGVSRCRPGLVCDVQVAGMDVVFSCAQPIAQGGQCVGSFQCQNGLQCAGVNLDMGQFGSCSPLKGAGATCENTLECNLDLVCTMDGTCGADPSAMCSLPTAQ